ncbi:MAG TPA: fumarylacetoacetate hydrolase family protein [Thermomicrobiales bacterium]|jgi:2-keto-4-pentenoate hydratase/2-oxohepta-3-ene-1,7-dioic acid hydratase in catechol pathway
MRLCTFERAGSVAVGVERDGKVYPTGYTDMLTLIREGEAGIERARATAESSVPVAVDRFLAPIPRPGTIFGSGVNYKAHADEEPTIATPTEPRIDFVKTPNAVIGPDADIVIPPHDRVIKRPGGFNVDYEVELGVVIGRRAKYVGRDAALDYVFGYTVFNDVGSRAVQFGVDRFAGDKNWYQADLGKNFDTFMPMGPVIVTSDEIPDLGKARIRAWVNGELRQDSLVGLQIFPVPVVIEWITSIITLEPGDCLLTGTPGGIGTFMDPPRYLKPGDVVTVAEDAIGRLTNRVVAG